MRLICPNCGAQYEVPEDVIPQDGRDVQCSNCGDTWFQPSTQMMAEEAEARAATPPPATEADPVDAAHTREDAPQEPPEDAWPSAPEPEPAAAEEHWHEDPDAPAPGTPPAAPPEPEADPAPAKRRLDPEISRVLREEAMREEALRSGRDSLETQPELGLEDLPEDEAARRARQSEERVARMQGRDPAPQAPAAPLDRDRLDPQPGSRRGLLPDIEDVATNAPGETKPATPPPADAPAPPARKRGFSRGFLLVILLMALAILVYSNAAMIAESLPQADPYLSSYVAWVDQWRLWLDAQAQALAAE